MGRSRETLSQSKQKTEVIKMVKLYTDMHTLKDTKENMNINKRRYEKNQMEFPKMKISFPKF